MQKALKITPPETRLSVIDGIIDSVETVFRGKRETVRLALATLRPLDEFHTEWARHARVRESARDWLYWSDVEGAVELARRLPENDSVVAYVRVALPLTSVEEQLSDLLGVDLGWSGLVLLRLRLFRDTAQWRQVGSDSGLQVPIRNPY
jgi:hypothetical protein